MDLGRYGIWTFNLDLVPSSQAVEHVDELDELGFRAVWFPEADRFLLGLGVSHQPMVEGVRGHDYSRPFSAMDAYLDAMDAAPFMAAAPSVEPQRVLAALGPRMLALARGRAAGAHPYFVPPEHTAEARAVLGHGPLLAVEQAVVLEIDPTRARAIARAHTQTYTGLAKYVANLRRLDPTLTEDDFTQGGSDRLVDRIVAWGSTDSVLAGCRPTSTPAPTTAASRWCRTRSTSRSRRGATCRRRSAWPPRDV